MVQGSVIIKTSENIFEICKENILLLKGKIKDCNKKEGVFIWIKRYGLQTVYCETYFVQKKENEYEVVIEASTDDIFEDGAKEIIVKFVKSLKEDIGANIISEKSIPTKVEKKKPVQVQSSQTKFNKTYLNIALFLFVMFLFFYVTKNSNNSFDEPQTYITNSGFFGAYSEDDFNKMVRYSIDKDKIALDELYISGKIFEIPSNKKAFLIKSKWGAVKIRIEGSSVEFWTNKEVISK